MFMVNRRQYNLISRALQRDDRFYWQEDVHEGYSAFREVSSDRLVAISVRSSPASFDGDGNQRTTSYAAGRVLSLGVDMLEEETRLDSGEVVEDN